MRAVWLTTLAVAALAGCAGPALDREDVLAGACQFKPCVCVDEAAPFWQKAATAEIIWSERVVPSCPSGFALQRADTK